MLLLNRQPLRLFSVLTLYVGNYGSALSMQQESIIIDHLPSFPTECDHRCPLGRRNSRSRRGRSRRTSGLEVSQPAQYGMLDKQYASKCFEKVSQVFANFTECLTNNFDTINHTLKHSDKCSVLKVFRTHLLVIDHLPSVCQGYHTGTNGFVSGILAQILIFLTCMTQIVLIYLYNDDIFKSLPF